MSLSTSLVVGPCLNPDTAMAYVIDHFTTYDDYAPGYKILGVIPCASMADIGALDVLMSLPAYPGLVVPFTVWIDNLEARPFIYGEY